MPSTTNHPTYFPRRVNSRVDKLAFASEVDISGLARCELGVLPAAAANNIMNAVDIAAIITRGGVVLSTFNPDTMMGAYGRNVAVILSGAGTPTVTVRGRDYLGQPMSENIVAAGAVSVAGKKAFKTIDSITTSAAVAATTLNLGTGNVLGLPYAMLGVDAEIIDDAIAAAGTFVPATLTAQTITSTDPRGSWTPVSVPNGVRNVTLLGWVIPGQLHGVPHFTS